MDTTTAFVLALIAIVVSGLSVIASFAALGQSSRFHPKPFLTHSIRRGGDLEERPTFIFAVTNMGKASAHDLKLVVRNRTLGGFEKLWNLIELPVSHPMDSRISMVTGGSSDRWKIQDGVIRPPAGNAVDMDMEFELSWRQGPSMKRLRFRSWKVAINDTNVFSYEDEGLFRTVFRPIVHSFREVFSGVLSEFRRWF